MPATLTVALLVGVIVFIAATTCIVMAPRLPSGLWIVATLVFAPLALFSIFGFAASFEPGDYHVVWRAGYVVTFFACLLALGGLALRREARKR